ncbi:MAG: sigma-70 family RNA polymerase sigma factor [Verrucomicrobiota bacterium]|jgi:RNA polymerase sigma-70 factor (ECF subfamily)
METRWTLVLRARGETPGAQSALSELCEAYYTPVLTFIRQGGRPDEAARDLTQEFFARLLAQHGLDTVQPGRGRFRSFLLGAVKHFLADQNDRAQAAKRGGGQMIVSIEAGAGTSTTTELQIPDPAGPVPDTVFDRQWALTLVERALNVLAGEFAAAGKAEQFETLKPWLLGEVESLSQADAARRLGLTEGAAKVAIHRLRKRFRELVKAEIAQTVDDATQVQDELRYLLEVLSQG